MRAANTEDTYKLYKKYIKEKAKNLLGISDIDLQVSLNQSFHIVAKYSYHTFLLIDFQKIRSSYNFTIINILHCLASYDIKIIVGLLPISRKAF